jgi:hypothetical protein
MPEQDTQHRDRELALNTVLSVLASRMRIMSPDHAKAIALVDKFRITADDLLDAARKHAERI